VKDYLLEILKQSYKKVTKTTREDNYSIHVSDLSNFCLRRYILCRQHNIPFNKIKSIPIGTGFTFDIGNKVQDIIFTRVAHFKIEKMIGIWVCPICNTQYDGLKPAACSKCNPPHGFNSFKYKELKLHYNITDKKNNVHTITGNIDLPILYADDKTILIHEIKSIKPDDFDTMDAPLPNHQIQLKGYLWLAKKNKNKYKHLGFKFHTKSGIILYASKLAKVEPFKVFQVNLDIATEKIFDKIEKDLKTFSNRNKLPRICQSSYSKKARNCPEVNACWHDK
jgi:hypothetical protein